MTLREDLIAYQRRFWVVAEFEREELLTTSIETKWQQLNSFISLAMRMGIFRSDPSKERVYRQWAKLKEKIDERSK